MRLPLVLIPLLASCSLLTFKAKTLEICCQENKTIAVTTKADSIMYSVIDSIGKENPRGYTNIVLKYTDYRKYIVRAVWDGIHQAQSTISVDSAKTLVIKFFKASGN